MSTLSNATGTTRTRHRNDFYPTVDPRAVVPLLPFLGEAAWFVEPCAGDGSLIGLLEGAGAVCYGRYDIAPQCPYIPRRDLFTINEREPRFITNPPWSRVVLHAMIAHLVPLAGEVWLLFDSQWCQTKQSRALGRRWCTDIVAAGRLKWFMGSANDATDDCSWYRFSADKDGPTRYHWPVTAGVVAGQGSLGL